MAWHGHSQGALADEMPGLVPTISSDEPQASDARAAGLPRQTNVAIRPSRNPTRPASAMDCRRFGAVFDEVALYACASTRGLSASRVLASASCALATTVWAVLSSWVSVASATASPAFDAVAPAMRAWSASTRAFRLRTCVWACVAWAVRTFSASMYGAPVCVTTALANWFVMTTAMAGRGFDPLTMSTGGAGFAVLS